MAPIQTQRIFRSLYIREKMQIACDNAAIALGRADRAMLNDLVRTSRLIKRLESQHHLVHHCRLVTPTRAACLIADQVVEARIRMLHGKATYDASQRWALARKKAEQELAAQGVSGTIENRPPFPPLAPVHCTQCSLPVDWTVTRYVESRVSEKTARIGTISAWIRRAVPPSLPWNYFLKPIENGQP